MNREIKFRVWNGEEMISPDYIDRDGNAHWYENSIPQISNKVMQFTGLKDKNGKEIYEGDILKFIDNYGGGIIKAEMCINFAPECLPEVIGNIYENPTLILKLQSN